MAIMCVWGGVRKEKVGFLIAGAFEQNLQKCPAEAGGKNEKGRKNENREPARLFSGGSVISRATQAARRRTASTHTHCAACPPRPVSAAPPLAPPAGGLWFAQHRQWSPDGTDPAGRAKAFIGWQMHRGAANG